MNNKILWIDDDINRYYLRSYIEEFEEQQYRIIKVQRVDDIEIVINEEEDFSAIIVDIAMPPGEKMDMRKVRGGLRTGMIILEELKKRNDLKNIPIVVFTNVDDDTVQSYCNINDIPFLKKEDYFSDELVKKLSTIINKSN